MRTSFILMISPALMVRIFQEIQNSIMSSAFASAGWEDRGYVANFDEWLKSARLDATRHKDDRDDDE